MASPYDAVHNPLNSDETVEIKLHDDVEHQPEPVVDTEVHEEEYHEEVDLTTRFPDWVYNYLEPVFKLRQRQTTIELEFFCGVIQFISCLYVLPVVPDQMARVGYESTGTIIATALTCAVGCIISAFLTNTPFIVAPPTSVSIFLAVSMQQRNLGPVYGNSAVIASGLCLMVIGAIPWIARFVTKLIPDSIQAATAVGIGLITALAGASEIKLVIQGQYTLLDMGSLTLEIVIAIGALMIVAVLLHYHVKGAFCIGLICGTFAWWLISGEWPEALTGTPKLNIDSGIYEHDKITLLVLNLVFLYILTLNGLARGLSDLSGLTKPNGAIPRGNWLLMVCGATSVLSGYFTGPPILLSPESAAGIKAGAKTGFSTLICGILFGFSAFFYPLFHAIPPAGTAPLLIMVGVVLFANTKRIDWSVTKYAVPAYCVLVFIPFTYSILRGVAFGYIMYIFISFYTGDYITNIQALVRFYTQVKPKLKISEISKTITLQNIIASADEMPDTGGSIFEEPAAPLPLVLPPSTPTRVERAGSVGTTITRRSSAAPTPVGLGISQIQ